MLAPLAAMTRAGIADLEVHLHRDGESGVSSSSIESVDIIRSSTAHTACWDSAEVR